MRYNIYGRYVIEVLREGEGWVAYRIDGFGRRRMSELVIPDWLGRGEIATYLDDILHEEARPGRRITTLD